MFDWLVYPHNKLQNKNTASPMNDAFQEQTKQYMEELKAGANSILVTVRVRPQTLKQKMLSSIETIRVLDGQMLILSEPQSETQETHRRNRVREVRFAFDFVFDQYVTTRQIYEDTVCGLLDGVMEGYHATVLAFGATSCGKTYTMIGENDKEPGIMALAVLDLLNRIALARQDKQIRLRAAYIQIYNENIKDLLISEDRNFDLREDPKQGVVIPGINEVSIENLTQLKTVLKVGSRNRTKESTANNEASSRSHAILQLTVEVTDKNPSLNPEIFISKFSMVDLAGSERGGTMGSNNQRLVEGTKINQSLLVLGNCIQALSEGNEKGQKNIYVPYRGSKLTRLLKDSLGGNCRTIMIAHLSPAASYYEQTYNTLVYVNRAKQIKNNAVRNNLVAELHVSNYANVIKNLKRENDDLKEQLKASNQKPDSPRFPFLQSQEYESEMQRIQESIDDHFNHESKLIKQIASLHNKIEILAFQIFAEQLNNQKTDKKTNQAAILTAEKIRLEEKLQQMEDRRESLQAEIKNNDIIGKIGQPHLLNHYMQRKVTLQLTTLKIKEDNFREEKRMMKDLIQVVKKKTGGQKVHKFAPAKLLNKKNNIISRITYSQLGVNKSLDVPPLAQSGQKSEKGKKSKRERLGKGISQQNQFSQSKEKSKQIKPPEGKRSLNGKNSEPRLRFKDPIEDKSPASPYKLVGLKKRQFSGKINRINEDQSRRFGNKISEDSLIEKKKTVEIGNKQVKKSKERKIGERSSPNRRFDFVYIQH